MLYWSVLAVQEENHLQSLPHSSPRIKLKSLKCRRATTSSRGEKTWSRRFSWIVELRATHSSLCFQTLKSSKKHSSKTLITSLMVVKFQICTSWKTLLQLSKVSKKLRKPIQTLDLFQMITTLWKNYSSNKPNTVSIWFWPSRQLVISSNGDLGCSLHLSTVVRSTGSYLGQRMLLRVWPTFSWNR